MLKVLVKNYSIHLDLTKPDSLSTLKTPYINYFIKTKERVATEDKTNIVMTAVTAK